MPSSSTPGHLSQHSTHIFILLLALVCWINPGRADESFSPLRNPMSSSSPSYSTYLRELPLIQTHTNGIHLPNRPIEMRLKIPVCAQRLLDMPDTTKFGVQLDGTKVLDIGTLEKHVSDCRGLFVNLQWMAGEYYAFGNDTGWVRGDGGAHGDQAVY